MDVNHLKKLMKERGVTQTRLAELLGRNKSAITLLMQGRRQLKADEAQKIAVLLDVPVGMLLGESTVMGMEEPVLIPFQTAPSKTMQASPQLTKKNNQFYFPVSEMVGKDPFALEVKDDGLNLAGILPGDIIIACLTDTYEANQPVVLQAYDDAGSAQTIVRIYQPPYLKPHSANNAHRPLHEKEDEVRIVASVKRLVRLYE